MCFITYPINSSKAGSNWNSYSSSHGGIGAWNLATDDKLSIEFISNSYTGALLPGISNGVLTWNNSAQIIITYPLSEDDWNRGALVSIVLYIWEYFSLSLFPYIHIYTHMYKIDHLYFWCKLE